MGQALYRKYRPLSFSEAVGQEAITETLEQAIKSERISHAYLFAGPRGVGKTSVARILAHQINQLPYTHDNFHLDIIEIDAASNRRIDEIRDLREKVHITPTSAKYKVYIIDEVHMLTKEAFNALLKTLEEPPAHCIFILATTEAHKLPETIISRTQRFNFKPISKSAAIARLLKIVKEEKINIDDDALDLLSEYGEGSLRDIIGLLDQLNTTGKKINQVQVRNFLGIPSLQATDSLIEAISEGNARVALGVLEELRERAASPISVAKVLSQRLRHRLLEDNDSPQWLNGLLKELVGVSASTSPQETLELAVLEAVSQNRALNEAGRGPSEPGSPSEKKQPEKPVSKPASNSVQISNALFSLEQWAELLTRVKKEAPSIYTVLRLAEPKLTNGGLELAFQFSLHQKKVQEARHMKLIARIIEELSGAKLVIKCSVDKGLAEKRIPRTAELDSMPDLRTISSIFGSAEVLES